RAVTARRRIADFATSIRSAEDRPERVTTNLHESQRVSPLTRGGAFSRWGVTTMYPNLGSAQRLEELPPQTRLRLVGLTQRETQVALLAARGLLVREIAQQLEVAPGTVKTLLARARIKLGCRTLRELAT